MSLTREKPVLLIDANYLGHKARFTLGEVLSFDDMRTGVIYGFLHQIISLATMFKTNWLFFFWDSKKSYRKDIFPKYKAHRKKDLPQEELDKLKISYEQFTKLRREILPNMGFRNIFIQRGLEADDLIAQAIRHIRPLIEIIIVSADEDLLQLLMRNHVSMWNPSKRLMMTESWVKEEKGVWLPEKWATVKCIAGCHSDGVPGVGGVGEKTAVKFLNRKLNRESVAYKKIVSVEGQKIAFRNAELVRLPHVRTKPITIREDKLSYKKFRKECKKYGMLSFLRGPEKKNWKWLLKGKEVI